MGQFETADGVTGAADGGLAYRGRSIRSWVERLAGADDAERDRAAESLVGAGLELFAALGELAPTLQRQRGAARAQTAADLGRLGARMLSVIPRFRAALRTAVLAGGDEAVRANALSALNLIGFGGASQVPALAEALRDEVPAIRAAAAQDLAQLGAEARDALPALTTACLNDPDLGARVQAGAALWRVGRRLYPALPALTEGLGSADVLTCWTAADCLGDMGPDAAEAVPALFAVLDRVRLHMIRTSVVLALERIDPKAAAGVSLP